MRILIVSFWFPPYNTIGSIRVGKLAKYLHRFQHDVRVVTASNQPVAASIPVEIPSSFVSYTSWINPNGRVKFFLGGRKAIETTDFDAKLGSKGSLLRSAAHLYRTLINFPDFQIGWFPSAVKVGAQLVSTWKPDVIYASAMPYTSLLVARKLSRMFKVPWVAELRDLWLDNPNYEYSGLRKTLETRLEKSVLIDATGMVTVSDPLSRRLAAKFPKQVWTVMNGFDPEDLPQTPGTPARDGMLRIRYTGMVYEGKQDVTPLFEALNHLGPLKERVRIEFYGRKLSSVEYLAREYGVTQNVTIHPMIPHSESLMTQVSSDVLLLLLWNDKDEDGIFTGKLFEYIGSRRPILAIGKHLDVAAKLINERKLGVVTYAPTEISLYLKRWLEIKRTTGQIDPLPTSNFIGLTREEQSREIESILLHVTRRSRVE